MTGALPSPRSRAPSGGPQKGALTRFLAVRALSRGVSATEGPSGRPHPAGSPAAWEPGEGHPCKGCVRAGEAAALNVIYSSPCPISLP